MTTPSPGDVLRVWENGLSRLPARRASALLGLACPDMPAREREALSIGRRDALLCRLRTLLFGPGIEGMAQCPACGEAADISFDLDALMAADTREEQSEFGLRDHGYDIRFRLPNGADMTASEASEDAAFAILDACILDARLEDEPVPTAQLPDEVIATLAEAMRDADPLAEVRLALGCPSCGHAWSALFDIGSFLWGEVQLWCVRLLRDIHEIAAAYGWAEEAILALSPRRRQAYLEMIRR